MGRGSESASGASSSSSGSESSREEGQDAMMLRKGVQRDQEQREDDIDDACPSDSPSASSSDSEGGDAEEEPGSDSGPAAAAGAAARAVAPALPALVGAITLVAPGDAEARNAEVRPAWRGSTPPKRSVRYQGPGCHQAYPEAGCLAGWLESLGLARTRVCAATPHRAPPPAPSPCPLPAPSPQAQVKRLLRTPRYFDPDYEEAGPRCFKCGGKGHFARDCANPAARERSCFLCAGYGHDSRECPNSERGRRLVGVGGGGSGGCVVVVVVGCDGRVVVVAAVVALQRVASTQSFSSSCRVYIDGTASR